jgi:hypothetical protein
MFPYNCLSLHYNDTKNFSIIEKYQAKNNITFDIICKSRSDIVFKNHDINLIVDNQNDTIIRHRHMMDIRHWGHLYRDTPILVSDSFAYGNYKSMKIYTSTYDWILRNDSNMQGLYAHASELYLTDSILQYIFYNIPGGGHQPRLTKDEVIDKYTNNPHGVKLILDARVEYDVLPANIRGKTNFSVDVDNILDYTQL